MLIICLSAFYPPPKLYLRGFGITHLWLYYWAKVIKFFLFFYKKREKVWQNAKCRMQNAKYKMQNAECKMQNAKFKMQNAECKISFPFIPLILLRRLFLLLARHSVQAPSALASCVGSVFRQKKRCQALAQHLSFDRVTFLLVIVCQIRIVALTDRQLQSLGILPTINIRDVEGYDTWLLLVVSCNEERTYAILELETINDGLVR